MASVVAAKLTSSSLYGQVMLVVTLTRSADVPTVNLGMALGLPAITDTWQKLGVPKEQLHPVPAMILGALNLTPISGGPGVPDHCQLGATALRSLHCGR